MGAIVGSQYVSDDLADLLPYTRDIKEMAHEVKIINLDEENLANTAQCSIPERDLAGKLRKKGFDLHTTLQSHYINTIGGHISGEPSAGFGIHGHPVGWNWQFLLRIKVFLPDISVFGTGTSEESFNAYQDPTYAGAMNGPDVSSIFIGDRGIFVLY